MRNVKSFEISAEDNNMNAGVMRRMEKFPRTRVERPAVLFVA